MSNTQYSRSTGTCRGRSSGGPLALFRRFCSPGEGKGRRGVNANRGGWTEDGRASAGAGAETRTRARVTRVHVHRYWWLRQWAMRCHAMRYATRCAMRDARCRDARCRDATWCQKAHRGSGNNNPAFAQRRNAVEISARPRPRAKNVIGRWRDGRSRCSQWRDMWPSERDMGRHGLVRDGHMARNENGMPTETPQTAQSVHRIGTWMGNSRERYLTYLLIRYRCASGWHGTRVS